MRVFDISTATPGSSDGAANQRRTLPTFENIRSRLNWRTVAAGLLILILFICVIALAAEYGKAVKDDDNRQAQASAATASTIHVAQPDPAKCGRWDTVVPRDDGAAIGSEIGVLTVHTVVLPSGKVLMTSGSSWRNKAPVPTWPQYSPDTLQPGTGLWAPNDFTNDNLTRFYDGCNYAGIYDPEENTWYRIHHPLPPPDPNDPDNAFLANDLFCSGHQLLPDGDALFIGGTVTYVPFRGGAKTTYRFDWRRELTVNWTEVRWDQRPNGTEPYYLWTYTGALNRGRWYAQTVPLLDGRLLVLGGFVDYPVGGSNDTMYEFEINPTLDFFDPANNEWVNVDISSTPNSPFATPIDPANWTSAATTNCTDEIGVQKCESYRYDALKLYPQCYLLPSGKIIYTNDGDFNSLRTFNGTYMRNTKRSYLMTVLGNRTDPQVAFELGPDRPSWSRNSGTSVRDPLTGNILSTGGMPNGGGTMLPGLFDVTTDDPTLTFGLEGANQFAGTIGSSQLEIYDVKGDRWVSWDTDFLGPGARTMHYMTLLPTKQILIVGGGNYDLAGPVHTPILVTPERQFDGSIFYRREAMAPHTEPRLYHSTAVLLPNGRVLASGGNTGRAGLHEDAPLAAAKGTGQAKFNNARVDRNLYFFTDSKYATKTGVLPTENYTPEIFSPPYVFIDSGRQPLIDSVVWMNDTSNVPPDWQPSARIGSRDHVLFHSFMRYTLALSGLPTTCAANRGYVTLIKLGSATHGWDGGQQLFELPIIAATSTSVVIETLNATKALIPPAFYNMFYVDCRGKPSFGFSVRYDNSASQV